MDLQSGTASNDRSSAPLCSVLKDVQLQIQQMLELERKIAAELKTAASTAKDSDGTLPTWRSMAVPEANEKTPKTRRISDELLRLHSEVAMLEREREQAQRGGESANKQGGVNSILIAPSANSIMSETRENEPATKKLLTIPSDYALDHGQATSLPLPTITLEKTSPRISENSRSPRPGSDTPSDLNADSGPKDVRKERTFQKRQLFADKDAMLQRVMCALAQPSYNVADFYFSSGFCQFIARHYVFENITMSIIFVNSVWMAVDIDHNQACSLPAAHPVFQIAEHLFCAYFLAEWLIRFGAFEKKKDIFKDAWMVFDLFLASSMVLDTWLLSIISYATDAGSCTSDDGSFGASVVRTLKLLRLCRTARMARILRRMPELMIMIKGMIAAARSVFFTLVLLFIIIYVFSLVFRQLTDKTVVGKKYFGSVPQSISSLLLQGTVPDQKDIIEDLGDSHLVLGCLAFFFVLLSGLTVLNMLVGVLVEVVGVVASVEKDEIAASYIGECVTVALMNKNRMNNEMNGLEHESDEQLRASVYKNGVDKSDFETLLTLPHVVKTMTSMEVDVVALAGLTDYLFKDNDVMSMADLLTLIMQMRGTKFTTVKDVVDLRKFIMQELELMHEEVTASIEEIKTQLRGQNQNKASRNSNGSTAMWASPKKNDRPGQQLRPPRQVRSPRQNTLTSDIAHAVTSDESRHARVRADPAAPFVDQLPGYLQMDSQELDQELPQCSQEAYSANNRARKLSIHHIQSRSQTTPHTPELM